MIAIGVATARATSAHADGLAALFARSDVACHCRYWHFEGTTNDWLARCAHAPADNERELRAGLDAGAPDALGVVAVHEPSALVVGWLKLAPATAVPKLYGQRIYRKLPCFEGDRTGVYAVGCVLVDPAHRSRGVARALLRAALDAARSLGARAVEAFPRRADELRPEEAFAGPYSLLAEAGFRPVHDFAPYPVMRLELGGR